MKPQTECDHSQTKGEESIDETVGHIHYWTVKCVACGHVVLVRTLGCNCKKEKGRRHAN